MSPRSIQLMLVASTALVCSISFAQTPTTQNAPGQQRHGMKKMDANGDKLISRDEAKSHPQLTQNFDKIDANKDGQLSRDEMKAFYRANKPDQDGDGNISKAEAAKKPHLAKNFDQIDTNKDGIITPAERQAWMAAHKGQGKK